MPTKNDAAWEHLFDQYRILEQIEQRGFYEISSQVINRLREARLMTKFDNKSQLPRSFATNNLSILPITRGSYLIAEFESFLDFNIDEPATLNIDFPPHIESLDYRDITSEASAINCTFVSRILNDFTGEENLYPTVSGRMSSSAFNFGINGVNFRVNVNNSQIEIDGGYEGAESLTLIEAKNYISQDFLIRQLYYPFKLWTNKIQKRIRSVFLTYTNGVFHLREYSFENSDHYNSLRLIRQRKYSFGDNHINIERIQVVLNETVVAPEPETPFPQADSFERIINLCELLKQRGGLTKEEITLNYGFTERQTHYYTAAGRYLGLIEAPTGQERCYTLSLRGDNIFNLPISGRQIEFIQLILSHGAFKRTLEQYLENGIMPDGNTIVNIMNELNLRLSETTCHRRVSTITGWINWIISLIEE